MFSEKSTRKFPAAFGEIEISLLLLTNCKLGAQKCTQYVAGNYHFSMRPGECEGCY